MLLIATDINPIDIVSHLPVLCEDSNIPYIFVPSKEELGHASATKRPTSCVMVCLDQKKKGKQDSEKDDEFEQLYNECVSEVEKLDSKILF